MVNPKLWDEYEIIARYIPCLISVICLVHFLVLFLGDMFWKGLASNIGWMIVVPSLSISLIAVLTLVQFQTTFAKHWIEETVFGQGGINFPTTKMLLYNGGYISKESKDEIRRLILKKFNFSLATIEKENTDFNNARMRAREAVGKVKIHVGKGVMTHKYNIRYGFFRNLIGGFIWGFIGSISCSILYGLAGSYRAMSFFIAATLIFTLLFCFKKAILNKLAYSYADRLFTEFTQGGDK